MKIFDRQSFSKEKIGLGENILVRNTDNTVDSRSTSQHIKIDLYVLYTNRPCLFQNTKLPSLGQVFLLAAAHFQVEC